MFVDTGALSRTPCHIPRHLQCFTLVAFLYHTRTLLTPPIRCHHRLLQSQQCNFSSTDFKPSGRGVTRVSPKTLARRAAYNASRPKMPTLTPTEKATFERIFQKLGQSQGTDPSEDAEKTAYLDNVENGKEQDSLASIFDEASSLMKASISSDLTAPLRAPTKFLESRRVDLTRDEPTASLQYPESLREAYNRLREAKILAVSEVPKLAKKHFGEELTGRSQSSLDQSPPKPVKQEVVVDESILKEKLRVSSLLELAETDFDVWRILEKDVFKHVEQLNALIIEEQKAEKAKPKMDGRYKDQRDAAAAAAAAALNAVQELPNPPKAKDPRIASVLVILQANYGVHCLDAMRILRTRFPTSLYATALIPHIKRLGHISYILGASKALYNEMLYIRWVHYRDLHACADLVNEMLTQGVGTNKYTHAVFVDALKIRLAARRQRRAQKKHNGGVAEDRKPAMSSALAAWWTMQGVMDGWARWEAADMASERQRAEDLVQLRRFAAAESDWERRNAPERPEADQSGDDMNADIMVDPSFMAEAIGPADDPSSAPQPILGTSERNM